MKNLRIVCVLTRPTHMIIKMINVFLNELKIIQYPTVLLNYQ